MTKTSPVPSTSPEDQASFQPLINDVIELLNTGGWKTQDEALISLLRSLFEKINDQYVSKSGNRYGYKFNLKPAIELLEKLKEDLLRLKQNAENNWEDDAENYRSLSENLQQLQETFVHAINDKYFRKKRRNGYLNRIGVSLAILAVSAGFFAFAVLVGFPFVFAASGIATLLCVPLVLASLFFAAIPFSIPSIILETYRGFRELKNKKWPFPDIAELFAKTLDQTEKSADAIDAYSLKGKFSKILSRNVIEINRRLKLDGVKAEQTEAENMIKDLAEQIQNTTLYLEEIRDERDKTVEFFNNQLKAMKGYQGKMLTSETTLMELLDIVTSEKLLGGKANEYLTLCYVFVKSNELRRMSATHAILALKLSALNKLVTHYASEDYVDNKYVKYKQERRVVISKPETRFAQRFTSRSKSPSRLDAVVIGLSDNPYYLFSPYSKKVTRELLEMPAVSKLRLEESGSLDRIRDAVAPSKKA